MGRPLSTPTQRSPQLPRSPDAGPGEGSPSLDGTRRGGLIGPAPTYVTVGSEPMVGRHRPNSPATPAGARDNAPDIEGMTESPSPPSRSRPAPVQPGPEAQRRRHLRATVDRSERTHRHSRTASAGNDSTDCAVPQGISVYHHRHLPCRRRPCRRPCRHRFRRPCRHRCGCRRSRSRRGCLRRPWMRRHRSGNHHRTCRPGSRHRVRRRREMLRCRRFRRHRWRRRAWNHPGWNHLG